MKNLFIILSTVLISSAAFAQKGSFYLGGNVGYGSSTTKLGSATTEEMTSWSISPEVGTFLTDNVQLGVGFTVMNSNTTTVNFQEVDRKVFGGTVYSRYFFGEGSKAFRPFLGVNVGVLPGSETNTNLLTNTEMKFDTFELNTNLNAGFAYALSPKVAVVGSLGVLGYSSEKIKPDGGGDEAKKESFGFDINSLGNRFNIGLYLTL